MSTGLNPIQIAYRFYCRRCESYIDRNGECIGTENGCRRFQLAASWYDDTNTNLAEIVIPSGSEAVA